MRWTTTFNPSLKKKRDSNRGRETNQLSRRSRLCPCYLITLRGITVTRCSFLAYERGPVSQKGLKKRKVGGAAKLLIFPQKTLAARYYVVPSASRPADEAEVKLKFMRRVFSRPSLPRGPGGASCSTTGTSRRGVRVYPARLSRGEGGEGMTRNRGGGGGGEGDLTEFANQISSLVYEILVGRSGEKGAGTLAFVPIIVPKPTFYPPCSCVCPRLPLNQPFPRQNCYLLETIVVAKEEFREVRNKDFFFPSRRGLKRFEDRTSGRYFLYFFESIQGISSQRE